MLLTENDYEQIDDMEGFGKTGGYATAVGIKKLVADHPYFIIGAGIKQVERWEEKGAFINFTCSSLKISAPMDIPVIAFWNRRLKQNILFMLPG